MEAAKTILAWISNMMYTSQIREAANPVGAVVADVSSEHEAVDRLRSIHPSLFVIEVGNLPAGWETAVKVARDQHIPVIAFGSQSEEDKRQAAVEAGCDEVMVNSKFAMDLPNLVAKYL